jgi:hypothetical protein
MRLTRPLISKTKKQLVEILKGLLPLGKHLGFISDQLPDKRWLLNMIHSLRPDHDIFVRNNKVMTEAITRQIPTAFKIPENIPPTLFRMGRRGYFTKTKEENARIQEKRLHDRKVRLLSIQKSLHVECDLIDAKVQKLEQGLQTQKDMNARMRIEEPQKVMQNREEEKIISEKERKGGSNSQ